MKKAIFMLGAAFMIGGCAYAVSPDLARKADTSIPFEKLATDPSLYKDTLVILGGTIAESTTIKDGTLIEVSQRPLDHWGKPMTGMKSTGRFLVLYTGYLDPLVYGPGRVVTVAGVIQGILQKSLTKANNRYPVVVSKELKLWPKERPTWNKPRYLDPLYNPHSSPRQYLE